MTEDISAQHIGREIDKAINKEIDNEKHMTSVTLDKQELEMLRYARNELSNNYGIDNIKQIEVIRRSLRCWRQLLELDDKLLLRLLSEELHQAVKSKNDPTSISIATSLAFAIFASLISKRGVQEASSFDTIPMNLQQIDNLIKSETYDKSYDQYISKALSELAISVDTVFLKRNSVKDHT
jgi:hypothetical protein